MAVESHPLPLPSGWLYSVSDRCQMCTSPRSRGTSRRIDSTLADSSCTAFFCRQRRAEGEIGQWDLVLLGGVSGGGVQESAGVAARLLGRGSVLLKLQDPRARIETAEKRGECCLAWHSYLPFLLTRAVSKSRVDNEGFKKQNQRSWFRQQGAEVVVQWGWEFLSGRGRVQVADIDGRSWVQAPEGTGILKSGQCIRSIVRPSQ
jgi:hypothetical protein